jgi:hypothetical protein
MEQKWQGVEFNKMGWEPLHIPRLLAYKETYLGSNDPGLGISTKNKMSRRFVCEAHFKKNYVNIENIELNILMKI